MDFFTGLGIACFIGLFVLFSVMQHRKVSALRAQDYESYKRLHPNHFNHGRISCFKCHSTRIQTRSLMERTYTRVHFCGQCGESLYYSAEK